MLLIFMFLLAISQFIHCETMSKLYNLRCDGNAKLVDNITCNLKALRRDMVIANLDLDVITTLQNVSAHFQVFKNYNEFRPFLIDAKFNWCEAIHQKGITGFYVNQMIRVLRKFSNIVKCKLKVGFLLKLKLFSNFYFRDICRQRICFSTMNFSRNSYLIMDNLS